MDRLGTHRRPPRSTQKPAAPPTATAPGSKRYAVRDAKGRFKLIPKDGLPDEATVKTSHDNLDFQRGVQAFLTAMPAAASQRSSVSATRNHGGGQEVRDWLRRTGVPPR